LAVPWHGHDLPTIPKEDKKDELSVLVISREHTHREKHMKT
jgi:hypothetical protein